MSRYENRVQLALALVMGLLLVANLFALALVALAPTTRETRAPVLFTVFVITLLVSVPSLLLIPRRLLKPYRKLVDEAERAPVAAARGARPSSTRPPDNCSASAAAPRGAPTRSCSRTRRSLRS